MPLREWLQRFWTGQRPKREADKARQDPINEDKRLSELAALIESGDFNEASFNRIANLMGQTDSNRSGFE